MHAKDKKILAELITNSRIPMNQLAKKTGVSREVASYRINRLKKDTILSFYPIIDFSSLGYRRYGCFIQLKGINAQEEENFFDYLDKHSFVTYFGPVIGKWNVVLDVLARDDTHLKEIMQEITRHIKPYLESYIISSTGSEEEIYPTKFVGVIKNNTHQKKATPYTLDAQDKIILKALSMDSRIEYTSLSSKAKMTPNAIKYRIRNLEKNGIIQGYTISLNYNALGLEFYNLQLKSSAEADTKFISYLRNNPYVVYYYKYLGQENWDIAIGVVVKSHSELRTFMIELKDHFGESIKIHDLYLVTHIIKDNVAPQGVFE